MGLTMGQKLVKFATNWVQAPMYLTDNVVMAGEIHDRDARLSHSNDVHIPPQNTDILKRSFIFNGSVIWNKLPDEIRMANDVLDFKWTYKKSILNPLFENATS